MVRLYGRKEVRAAAYNRIAAHHFLILAQKSKEGRLYTCKASLVFSAFTLEAFLNSLGPKVYPVWSEIARIGPLEKLKVLAHFLSYELDFGKRPHQTVTELVKFRNSVAHGRDEIITLNGREVPRQKRNISYTLMVKSEWVKYCKVANAKRAYEDVGQLAEGLASKANIQKMPGYPFGSPESGMLGVHDA